MTAEATTPGADRCLICGGVTLSGQFAHGECGGYLPEDQRHDVLAAACHIEKLLRRRPRTVEWLRARMRPEFHGEVFEWALDALEPTGKLEARRGHGQLKLRLVPERRPRRIRDDGGKPGLFELPQRATKS
jgi:hypothetical protein